jgi:hypothetical protein
MHRTHRQAPLFGQVGIAMSRREARRTAASRKTSLTRRSRHGESEQLARWESEGGALGRTAGQRPRPLP